MNSRMLLDLFAEDHAHESLIGALVTRITREEDVQATCRTRSARGGHGRAIKEFRLYQRLLSNSQIDTQAPDLIVVAIDTNCARFSKKREEIEDATLPLYRHKVVPACPDPHVERWFLADPTSFQTVVGAMPSLGTTKCERDHYKDLLMTTIRDAGHPSTLGGTEFAPDLADGMDLYRAGKTDPSLRAFIDDFRAALKTWKG